MKPGASGRLPISYDGHGNTVAETRPGGITVAASYDGHAQLTGYSRSNIGAQTYFYNGMGDRVRVVKPTGTRHFVYDSQGRVVAEYGASASEVKAEFIWAGSPMRSPIRAHMRLNIRNGSRASHDGRGNTGGETGMGVFEQLAIGDYAPLGLAGLSGR